MIGWSNIQGKCVVRYMYNYNLFLKWGYNSEISIKSPLKNENTYYLKQECSECNKKYLMKSGQK